MTPLLIFVHIIFGSTILGVSYLLKKHYPKEINPIIGYRTKRSMASQEAWIKANKYAGNLTFKFGLFTVACQLLILLVWGLVLNALLAVIILWVLLLISVLILTERHLKKAKE